ncbi:MAG: hypothetical protein ABJO53_02250, partial [Nonlabens ulvanivorans]
YCHQHQKCIIFSSHELSIALALADEVLAINDLKLTHQSKAEFVATGMLSKMFPSPLLDFKDGKLGLRFKQSKSTEL